MLIFSNTDSKSPSPELINEWSKLLKDQSSFHVEELDRWRKALNDAITLLKQVCIIYFNNHVLCILKYMSTYIHV